MKKYEFTGETMEFEGHLLQRIRYVRTLLLLDEEKPNPILMKKGEIGGWIEGEHNLSHEGNCCVLGVAKVFGNARVNDDARVGNNSIVKDNAQLFDNARIFQFAVVGADSIISGKTQIFGKSEVFFYADENYGQSNISGKSVVSNSIIEATGRILDSQIKSQKLYGKLDMIAED